MKKSILIALCLLLVYMTGASALTVSEENAFPIVDEPYELDVWCALAATIEDMNTNETTKWYEEKTGIHVNWTQVAPGEASTKFNLSISSGDYPDIYSTGLSTDQVTQYSQSGIFIPLDDLIEEYGYNIKNAFAEHPEIKEGITASDGKIYCLFRTDPATYVLVRNKLYVNHDWTEKYMADTGLAAPATYEELEAMLLYWRDNDMNGNGDATDEIPMIGTSGTSGGDFTVYLMNAFQPTPESNFMLADENGNVRLIANTDEYREGLQWMRHLYDEGLIAEETFIQDNSQLQALVNKNDPKERTVGAFGGFWAGVTVTPSMMDNCYDVYDPLPPIAGPDGLRVGTTDGHTPLYLVGAITSACERPDIAMKWLDFWFSNEGMVMIDYGFENVNWEWRDAPAINGNTPSRFFLTPRNVLQNTTWYVGTVPYYRTEESLFGRTPTDHVPYLYEGALAYEDYYYITGFPVLAWCSDIEMITEWNELKTQMNDYLQRAKIQFITGALDASDDEAWNAYLKQIEDIGLERYLELTEIVNFG